MEFQVIELPEIKKVEMWINKNISDEYKEIKYIPKSSVNYFSRGKFSWHLRQLALQPSLGAPLGKQLTPLK